MVLVPPDGVVPALHDRIIKVFGVAVEIMARLERFVTAAIFVQRLGLGREPDGAVLAPTDVQGADTDGITGRKNFTCLCFTNKS